MDNQEKVRKTRATPMRWMRFFRVKVGDTVYYGKKEFIKLSFCTAILSDNEGIGDSVMVNPFRRVRTAKPMKRPVIVGTITKALMKGSPFVGALTSGTLPENAGKTHFVGDDCPGGHHEIPKTVGGEQSNDAKP